MIIIESIILDTYDHNKGYGVTLFDYTYLV